MTATLWRYLPGSVPAFDPAVFDERALARRAALAGAPPPARGDVHFFSLEGHELVLRHCRRGGLARRLAARRHLWTGLERTRVVAEFELLRSLAAEGLPVPPPFACAVTRHGPLWSGSLVTRRLPGRSLAERLGATAGVPAGADPQAGLEPPLWEAIGRCIARFHRAGVRHARLDAHHVVLDGEEVWLIGFDRARRRRPGPGAARWRRVDVRRLHRSLVGLATEGGRDFDVAGFAALERAWRDALG